MLKGFVFPLTETIKTHISGAIHGLFDHFSFMNPLFRMIRGFLFPMLELINAPLAFFANALLGTVLGLLSLQLAVLPVMLSAFYAGKVAMRIGATIAFLFFAGLCAAIAIPLANGSVVSLIRFLFEIVAAFFFGAIAFGSLGLAALNLWDPLLWIPLALLAWGNEIAAGAFVLLWELHFAFLPWRQFTELAYAWIIATLVNLIFAGISLLLVGGNILQMLVAFALQQISLLIAVALNGIILLLPGMHLSMAKILLYAFSHIPATLALFFAGILVVGIEILVGFVLYLLPAVFLFFPALMVELLHLGRVLRRGLVAVVLSLTFVVLSAFIPTVPLSLLVYPFAIAAIVIWVITYVFFIQTSLALMVRLIVNFIYSAVAISAMFVVLAFWNTFRLINVVLAFRFARHGLILGLALDLLVKLLKLPVYQIVCGLISATLSNIATWMMFYPLARILGGIRGLFFPLLAIVLDHIEDVLHTAYRIRGALHALVNPLSFGGPLFRLAKGFLFPATETVKDHIEDLLHTAYRLRGVWHAIHDPFLSFGGPILRAIKGFFFPATETVKDHIEDALLALTLARLPLRISGSLHNLVNPLRPFAGIINGFLFPHTARMADHIEDLLHTAYRVRGALHALVNPLSFGGPLFRLAKGFLFPATETVKDHIEDLLHTLFRFVGAYNGLTNHWSFGGPIFRTLKGFVFPLTETIKTHISGAIHALFDPLSFGGPIFRLIKGALFPYLEIVKDHIEDILHTLFRLNIFLIGPVLLGLIGLKLVRGIILGMILGTIAALIHLRWSLVPIIVSLFFLGISVYGACFGLVADLIWIVSAIAGLFCLFWTWVCLIAGIIWFWAWWICFWGTWICFAGVWLTLADPAVSVLWAFAEDVWIVFMIIWGVLWVGDYAFVWRWWLEATIAWAAICASGVIAALIGAGIWIVGLGLAAFWFFVELIQIAVAIAINVAVFWIPHIHLEFILLLAWAWCIIPACIALYCNGLAVGAFIICCIAWVVGVFWFAVACVSLTATVLLVVLDAFWAFWGAVWVIIGQIQPDKLVINPILNLIAIGCGLVWLVAYFWTWIWCCISAIALPIVGAMVGTWLLNAGLLIMFGGIGLTATFFAVVLFWIGAGIGLVVDLVVLFWTLLYHITRDALVLGAVSLLLP